MTAIAMALQLLNILPSLISAGIEVKGLIEEHSGKLQTMADEGRDPTEEEWESMNAQIAALRAQLHG